MLEGGPRVKKFGIPCSNTPAYSNQSLVLAWLRAGWLYVFGLSVAFEAVFGFVIISMLIIIIATVIILGTEQNYVI